MANITVSTDINSLLTAATGTPSKNALGVLGAVVKGTGDIVNADISPTAAINVSKLSSSSANAGLVLTSTGGTTAPTFQTVVGTSSSSIIVNAQGTDLQRGQQLLTAYAAAKLLTPNGLALSAKNRAQVIIPTGQYKVVASFVLDTQFVDLIAQSPTSPNKRHFLTVDNLSVYPYLPDFTHFKPSATLIYCDADYITTIKQTANDVKMHGFSVAQLSYPVDFYDSPADRYVHELDWGALLIGQNCANAPSLYTDMYFWTLLTAFTSCGGVRAYDSFSGTWINCVSNSASFRNGFGDKVTQSAIFSAKMYDCMAGPFSFIGDYLALQSGSIAQNAIFERCTSIGYGMEGGEGKASFAGCNQTAAIIESTCSFTDCISGSQSFGIGALTSGTFIRCRAGENSFGSMYTIEPSGGGTGIFYGYAEDCIGGANSFGGNVEGGYGKLTGTLVRCTVTDNVYPLRLEGATIRDCRITNSTTGRDGVVLLDSLSSITNSDIIVFQGGTGKPINAASAKNVVAASNRMNNATTGSATGLGANVTNLVTSANNVVSNSIR